MRFDYQTSHFHYSVYPKTEYCDIHMQTHPNYKTTKSFPHTLNFLQQELVSIFQNDCYNPEGLPFAKEVVNTETGHLLEHVLLEYLCQQKVSLGHSEASYCGRTFWNKEMYDHGIYFIRIKVSLVEIPLLKIALNKSYKLMEKLISFSQTKADSPTLSAWRPNDLSSYMSSVSNSSSLLLFA